jgi:hypothetical protein
VIVIALAAVQLSLTLAATAGTAGQFASALASGTVDKPRSARSQPLP